MISRRFCVSCLLLWGQGLTAKLINGREIARKIRKDLRHGVAELRQAGVTPSLVSISVGRTSSSALYVQNQQRSCEELGIAFNQMSFPEDVSEQMLLAAIRDLNDSSTVSGILLQMPVPSAINSRRIHVAIRPEKDVEGMNPINLGQVVYGRPNLAPCTAMGAVELIRSTGIDFRGKEAVVVGHSEIVGKPISLLLLNELATTTVCHIGTRDLKLHTTRADILVVAVGKPNLIGGGMIKPGAVVIDVGINVIAKKDLQGNLMYDENHMPRTVTVGDVNFEEASAVASHITPVPGGVGPLTVAMLLKNTVQAARIAAGLHE